MQQKRIYKITKTPFIDLQPASPSLKGWQNRLVADNIMKNDILLFNLALWNT